MRTLYWIVPLLGVFLLTLIIQAQDVPTFTSNVGEQQDYPFRIYSHALNVRSGPSREYSIRGVIYDNNVLTVTGRTNFDTNRTCDRGYYINRDMWLRVDFQGIEGWVAYCLGIFKGDLNALPIVEPAYPVNRWEAGRYPSTRYDKLGNPPTSPYIIANLRYQRVYLRRTPSLDGELVDILTSDSVYVTGYSEDGYWLQVSYLGLSPVNRQWRHGLETQIGWIAINTVFTLQEGWEDRIPIIE